MLTSLQKMLFFVLKHTILRFRLQGIEHLPKEGPALLVSNRLTITDLFILTSVSPRPIRFLMPVHLYKRFWVRPFADLFHVIPLPTAETPAMIVKELKTVSEAVEKGELVCMFPEETPTADGLMVPFGRLLEIVMRGLNAPIIPLFVDNIWFGAFDERVGRKVAKYYPYPVQVYIGKPMNKNATASEVNQAIRALGYDSWLARKKYAKPIHFGYIRNVRLKPFKTIVGEEATPKMSYLKTLIGGIVLARKLSPQWAGDEFVGVLLPQCIPSVVSNVAVTLSGRAVVNLNFSTGIEYIESAIRQAKIRVVITSRAFLEKLNFELPEEVNVIYLEDLKGKVSRKEKLIAAALAIAAPIRLIEKACGARKRIVATDPLAVIFTSGSTAEPKGVVLTHYNVSSNAHAISQVLYSDTGKESTLAVLPFFHSFGYMLLWLGLNYDLQLFLYPNPLDYPKIGEMAEKFKVSIIISTPTFLRGYLKKIPPRQFRSVKTVLTGAERMPRLLAEAFQDKFKIVPIEGFGTTECSPVVSTNILDCRKSSEYPYGFIPGTVGPPLPGTMVKIVDPETLEELPEKIPGLLLVKGPSVMEGYLNRPDLTKDVLKDGWYFTGDVAYLDADGYIFITDRLSRFSKIGGEMVPHCKIEEALHYASGQEPPTFAVTTIPDQKKGERLAVLHTWNQKKIGDLLRKLHDQGLPNLFIPKPDHFFYVKALPILGSGKLDLRKLKKIAIEKQEELSNV